MRGISVRGDAWSLLLSPCNTEKATKAWHRQGRQKHSKTRPINNQPKRPSSEWEDHSRQVRGYCRIRPTLRLPTTMYSASLFVFPVQRMPCSRVMTSPLWRFTSAFPLCTESNSSCILQRTHVASGLCLFSAAARSLPVLHGESSKRLASPRNTKDKKHLQ